MTDPLVFYPARHSEARCLLAEIRGHLRSEINHMEDGPMKALKQEYFDRIGDFLAGPIFHFNTDEAA